MRSLWLWNWLCGVNVLLLKLFQVRILQSINIEQKLKACRLTVPYRRDVYEPLNRTSSRIVRVAASSGVAQQFRIELPPKVEIKNSTSSVYSSLYAHRSRMKPSRSESPKCNFVNDEKYYKILIFLLLNVCMVNNFISK